MTRLEQSYLFEHNIDIFAERVLFPLHGELQGNTLDPTQRKILTTKAPEIQMLWSRQTGKTRLLAMLALHGAVFNKPLTLIVSGGERQAQIVQERVSEHALSLGRDEEWQDVPGTQGFGIKDVFAETIEIVRLSARELTLGNGHRVRSAPASSATIRGFSPHRIIIDESAYVPNSVFEAVTPMRAVTGAQLICASSAAGQAGWFYDWWMRDDPGRMRSEYRADQCTRITERDPNFLPRERQRLEDSIYRREYENEFMPLAGQAISAAEREDMYTDSVAVILGGAQARRLASESRTGMVSRDVEHVPVQIRNGR